MTLCSYLFFCAQYTFQALLFCRSRHGFLFGSCTNILYLQYNSRIPTFVSEHITYLCSSKSPLTYANEEKKSSLFSTHACMHKRHLNIVTHRWEKRNKTISTQHTCRVNTHLNEFVLKAECCSAPPVQSCGLENVLSASEQFEFQIIERSRGICLSLSN